MPLFHHPLPREGGDPDQGQPAVGAPQVWVPACAGNTDVGDNLRCHEEDPRHCETNKQGLLRRCAPLPPEGEVPAKPR